MHLGRGELGDVLYALQRSACQFLDRPQHGAVSLATNQEDAQQYTGRECDTGSSEWVARDVGACLAQAFLGCLDGLRLQVLRTLGGSRRRIAHFLLGAIGLGRYAIECIVRHRGETVCGGGAEIAGHGCL